MFKGHCQILHLFSEKNFITLNDDAKLVGIKQKVNWPKIKVTRSKVQVISVQKSRKKWSWLWPLLLEGRYLMFNLNKSKLTNEFYTGIFISISLEKYWGEWNYIIEIKYFPSLQQFLKSKCQVTISEIGFFMVMRDILPCDEALADLSGF